MSNSSKSYQKSLKVLSTESTSNKLLQEYISTQPKHIICIDITFLQDSKIKRPYFYFVGIDLASRAVVGHFLKEFDKDFKEGHIQIDDILSCLQLILEAEPFKDFKARSNSSKSYPNKVEIVHSRKASNSFRESFFSNNRYSTFLESKNLFNKAKHEVLREEVLTEGFDEQLVERLHRTLKRRLRKRLQSKYPDIDTKPLLKPSKYSSEALSEALTSTIIDYNNSRSTLSSSSTSQLHHFGFSPNEINQAFISYAKSTESTNSASKSLRSTSSSDFEVLEDQVLKRSKKDFEEVTLHPRSPSSRIRRKYLISTTKSFREVLFC